MRLVRHGRRTQRRREPDPRHAGAEDIPRGMGRSSDCLSPSHSHLRVSPLVLSRSFSLSNFLSVYRSTYPIPISLYRFPNDYISVYIYIQCIMLYTCTGGHISLSFSFSVFVTCPDRFYTHAHTHSRRAHVSFRTKNSIGI